MQIEDQISASASRIVFIQLFVWVHFFHMQFFSLVYVYSLFLLSIDSSTVRYVQHVTQVIVFQPMIIHMPQSTATESSEQPKNKE